MTRMSRPVVVAVVLHALMVAVYVARHQGDVSCLVCASEQRAGRGAFECVHSSCGGGFDGQYYYVIAQDPWKRQGDDVDFPAYRHQRILFPALAWALSGGHPYLLLWVLPGLNLAAVGVMTYLGTRVAREFGWNEWWGLLLPLAVNAGLPMFRDLTDVCATCAVAGFLVGWLLDWKWWALSLWAAAAVFAREQNIAVVGLAVGASLWKRHYGTVAGLAAVLALWAGWIGVLRLTYGSWPVLHSVFETPFTGLVHCFQFTAAFGPWKYRTFHLAYLVAFAAQLVLCIYLAAGRGERLISTVGLLGAFFAVMAGWTFTYNDFWSYGRLFSWVPLGIWLNSMRARVRWPLLTTVPSIFFPLHILIYR